MRRISLAALLSLSACASAPPSTPNVEPTPPARVEASIAPVRDEPELVYFKSKGRTLGGFVWKPAGAGPFPTIVFNHGSEQLPGTKEGQARFFVPHGFVVFVPHRRGQGRSSDAGRYIDDFFDDAVRTSTAFTDELVAQNDDVIAAVAYAASLPYVDPNRIAVSGCSLGGIESLFAAERSPGIVAAIDFAGAAMTWAKSPPLQKRMKVAAENARVPVFFIQAQNDYDTTPSLTLSAAMKTAGKPMRVQIYPPKGATAADGHGFCAGGPNPPWGDDVLAFLAPLMR